MKAQDEHTFDFVQGEVLLIDKPLDWTSFDVVNHIRHFIRRLYKLKKIKVGHAGTLDPLATGLLILCTGKMTRRIDEFQGLDKVYVGSMTLGATTPSFDMETQPDRFFPTGHLRFEDMKETAEGFTGEIEQFPPQYSAVKVKGKRAFEYARKDEEVKLKARKVRIHRFELLNYAPPQLDFYVECSKGAYIRSLVNDFGKALGNGAFLSGLRRTKIGGFSVNDAFTIEGFKQKVEEQIGSC